MYYNGECAYANGSNI